jgi:hypothetical protein
MDINMGNMRRQVTSMIIDPLDKFGYFGTKTGDIIEIDLPNRIYKRQGPVKALFSQGINTIKLLPNSDILIGTGDGTIAKLGFRDMKIKAQSKIMGSVTSITQTADSAYFFAATDQSNIYWCEAANLNSEIRNTCHYDRINDICFPL